MEFTSDEKKLIEYARKRILQYCKMRKSKDLYDVIYAFVLSESGKIYEGTPLEVVQPNGSFCAERHAIANMVLAESEKAKIVSIFTAGPVPKRGDNKGSAPCGVCRSVISEFSTPETSIICSEFIKNENDWELFPSMDKYKVKDLYPNAYVPVKWE